MSIFASIFTGGGGADLGASQAEYCHAWGVEIDRNVADHAKQNGFNVMCQDVTQLNLKPLLRPDVLWASPPCQSFSDAKIAKGETEADLKLAQAVSSVIWIQTPHAFVLENVPQYAKSESFRIILERLKEYGYDVDVRVLNAADFGVPQVRRRLILRACLGKEVLPITPTHSQKATLFTNRWVSWYEAIKDLIPTLPTSKLADWQVKKLEARAIETMLVSHQTWGQALASDFPMRTVTNSNASMPKAILVDGANASGITHRLKEQPAQAVLASGRNIPRVIFDCRVVQLTVRCLARFQSFPDSYTLPETKRLGCKIVGNAVPPLFAQRILESLRG